MIRPPAGGAVDTNIRIRPWRDLRGDDRSRIVRRTIDLPFPPSVNRLWGTATGGRRYLMPRQRAYRERCLLIVRPPRGGTDAHDRYAVSIRLTPPDRRRRDVDNLVKPVLDVLEKAGAIHDDAQVDDLNVRMDHAPTRHGRCTVTIHTLTPTLPTAETPVPDDYFGL